MEFLPTEVILEIFSFLDAKALLQVAHTCHLFYDIITTSANLVQKFSIEITNDSKKIPFPNANYQKAILKGVSQYLENFRYIENFSSTLKILSLHEIFFANVNQCRNFIKNMQILHTLEIENCKILHNTEVESIEIPSLKKLKINRGSWKIFQILENCKNVTDLKFEIYSKEINFMHHLNNFLANNENLKNLEVYGCAKNFINSTLPFSFQLQRLKIDIFYFHDLSEKQKMLEFLKNNCLNLRELVICNAPRDQFLKFILNDLRNLEKLEFGMSLLPESVNFFNTMENNYKLKTLILRGRPKFSDVLKMILKHYRGIKTLEILDASFTDFSDILITVTETHKNLEHLTLPSLPGIISPMIDLKSLKTLNIQSLSNKTEALNLTFLVIYSPNIKKLLVKCVHNIFMDNTDISLMLSKAKYLEELNFGKNFEFDDQAMNIIKNTAKNLKRLTIYTYDVERMKAMVERIHNDGLHCFIYKGHNIENDKFDDFEVTQKHSFNNIANYADYLRNANIREHEHAPVLHVRYPVEPNMNMARMRRIARRRIRNFNNDDVILPVNNQRGNPRIVIERILEGNGVVFRINNNLRNDPDEDDNDDEDEDMNENAVRI
ncbi:hypothetical protein PVAND_017087 [Polypedilum vanderplanki]|uniref:F-box domain-containing protein n=1 Tax=Polypedilum vanderplanki TaxID=319348 RepID=A0A9J6BHL2_POLVA|nr:hypothetical protein PVAND_017087 [Polypedilum vanderplanki]